MIWKIELKLLLLCRKFEKIIILKRRSIFLLCAPITIVFSIIFKPATPPQSGHPSTLKHSTILLQLTSAPPILITNVHPPIIINQYSHFLTKKSQSMPPTKPNKPPKKTRKIRRPLPFRIST